MYWKQVTSWRRRSSQKRLALNLRRSARVEPLASTVATAMAPPAEWYSGSAQ
jgi:hypothetical protein